MKKFSIADFLNSANVYTSGFILSLATLSVSLLIGITYRFITSGIPSEGNELPNQTASNIAYDFMATAIIMPLIETCFNQLLIISILKKLRTNDPLTIAIATLIFSAGHLRNSILSALNTIFTGLVLNYAYIHWLNKTRSKMRAFEAALLIHTLHNFYYFLMGFIPSPF